MADDKHLSAGSVDRSIFQEEATTENRLVGVDAYGVRRRAKREALPTSLAQELGEYVRAAREATGLKPKVFAKRMQVTVADLARIEAGDGTKNLSVSSLHRMAEMSGRRLRLALD